MIVTASMLFKFTASLPDSTGTRSEFMQLINQIANGTAIDSADQCYAAQRTITNHATPDVLDLNAGGLVGSDRSIFSVLHLTTIIGVNFSSAQQLTFGPAAANGVTTILSGTTPGLILPPSSNPTNKIYSYFVIHCQ